MAMDEGSYNDRTTKAKEEEGKCQNKAETEKSKLLNDGGSRQTREIRNKQWINPEARKKGVWVKDHLGIGIPHRCPIRVAKTYRWQQEMN